MVVRQIRRQMTTEREYLFLQHVRASREAHGLNLENAAEQLAALAVRCGANVQRGQVVAVSAALGQENLARAVAESAYRCGAKFVDVQYYDPHIKRARISLAEEATLGFVPSWYGERVVALGDQRCASLSFSGPSAPGLLDGLDPARAGKDQLPYLNESTKIVSDRTTNWCVVPGPNAAWASLVHPDLDRSAALEKLWHEIAHVVRLDTPDPVASWEDRIRSLAGSAALLTARRFDAIHLQGPGTDLTVGLFATGRWIAAELETVDGIRHIPNLPTEEVFTTPDPSRTHGIVSSTRPLVLRDGTMVEDLVVRFESGRAVQVDASQGAETLRGRLARDEGASRLGELALVDGSGRIAGLETTFYDTLLDENAASHLALGNGIEFLVDESERPRVNQSGTHIDFMVGAAEVDVTGLTPAGERVLVMQRGEWRL